MFFGSRFWNIQARTRSAISPGIDRILVWPAICRTL